MAKIKVHELAKELGKQSKDILSFLQEKGIEAKVAQSSIEEDAAQLVRKAFASTAKADAPKAEDTKAESVKAGAAKAETAKTEAKAEAPKAEESKAAAGEAAESARAEEGQDDTPKKKKKIIFVSNPQNSRVPGQRPSQGGAQARPNNNNQGRTQNGYGRVQAQAPVRPIKPLTPPSPTPSVQMVPENRGQQKPRQDRDNNAKQQVQAQQSAPQTQAQTQQPAPQQPAPQQPAPQRKQLWRQTCA